VVVARLDPRDGRHVPERLGMVGVRSARIPVSSVFAVIAKIEDTSGLTGGCSARMDARFGAKGGE